MQDWAQTCASIKALPSTAMFSHDEFAFFHLPLVLTFVHTIRLVDNRFCLADVKTFVLDGLSESLCSRLGSSVPPQFSSSLCSQCASV